MKIILIVEDNRDYRVKLAESLRLETYYILEAENGLIGLEMISNHSPDLIICDVDMPIMTGVEMLVSVKQNSRFSRIPFIFITAHTDEVTQKHMKGLGADLCLTKSVSVDHVITLINDLLNTADVQ